MGCFDTVRIPCPKCGSAIEEQSKAGPCNLNTYTLSDMPQRVAADLSDSILTCKCGATVRFHVQFLVTPYLGSPEEQDNYDDDEGSDELWGWTRS